MTYARGIWCACAKYILRVRFPIPSHKRLIGDNMVIFNSERMVLDVSDIILASNRIAENGGVLLDAHYITHDVLIERKGYKRPIKLKLGDKIIVQKS